MLILVRAQDEGVVALAEGMTSSGTLLSLLLASNGMGGPGLVALAAALGRNRTLLELDVSYNAVGEPGAVRSCTERE
jgi:hypothetical protein